MNLPATLRFAERTAASHFVVLVCAMLNFSAPATAEEVVGWRVSKVNDKSCVAFSSKIEDEGLGFAADGPQVWLFITSPSFESAKGEIEIGIKVDDAPDTRLQAIGQDFAYRTIVNRRLFESIKAASNIVVAIGGQQISFHVQNVKQALDALSHCAGTATLEEMWAPPVEPVPSAGEWKLDRHLPGTTGCVVRVGGAEVDTILALNNVRKLLLLAARPDWVMEPGQHQIQIQIDELPPFSTSVFNTNNLVVALIADDEIVAKLRVASTITWLFPNAKARAQVSGLGTALDALLNCQP